MTVILIFAGWFLFLAFIWCLCRAAAMGDRMAQRARDDVDKRRGERDELATVVRLYPRVVRDVSVPEPLTGRGEDGAA